VDDVSGLLAHALAPVVVLQCAREAVTAMGPEKTLRLETTCAGVLGPPESREVAPRHAFPAYTSVAGLGWVILAPWSPPG
jgi:hypothetical protein